AAVTGGSPRALTVDGLVSPIGLGLDDVYFAWHLGDDRRGARQGAYRIVVSRPRLPATGGSSGSAPVVWDSGRVASAEQAFVSYRGPALSPDTGYRWTVQSWPATGGPSPLAPHATFETGLTDHDWKARWISRPFPDGPGPDDYTYARHDFSLPSSPIVRARAYVSGDQQYELYVNGTRAGKGQAYSFPDSQYYEALDVTALVRAGAPNALSMVSSWQGPTKGHPAGKPGVMAQISVLHRDGRRQLVVTDGSWKVSRGPWLPGTQRDLEGDFVDFTENIDGGAEPVGWQEPGFDDSTWAGATVLGPAGVSPWRHLVPVRTRIVEQPVPALSLTRLASGAVVADFGKVYAAVPTVHFHHGTPGRLVTMRAGYLLDEPVPGQPFAGVAGQVSTTHGTQHTDMSYSYVQRGGDEEFHPFDYLGFRYFQIDEPGETLTPADVVARTRHAAVPDEHAATFASSSPVVDAVFELGRHSALFGAQEQWIDTPTREKGPWLWDGFNESQTAMVAFGEQNLTRKSLLEFAQSQHRFWAKSGSINKIYPTGLGAEDINEYTEIYPEWVWQYWMRTGDRALLAAVYPVLLNIAGYVDTYVDPSTGLVDDLLATEVAYDYPIVTRDNVLGVNVYRRAADVATALGRPAHEVTTQRKKQARLTAAINRHLTRPDGTYVDGIDNNGAKLTTASQSANACALAYGVVPAKQLSTVVAYVAGLGMAVPVSSATDVLKGLADNGRVRDMVGILTDPVHDGWANILARGATFTWEVWEPSDANGDSMSHGWGSNVLVEIQQTLLGVRPSSPGYATFDVAPPAAGLDWAGGTVPTLRGPIAVAWRRGGPGGAFVLDVTVPPNASATVHVPAAGAHDVTEGGRSLPGVAGVRVVSSARGQVVVAVGAGRYEFRAGSGT
ncbi:MAG TPA: family 78 glycoside hydrolase catalytic domain, partial [Acidimicrobiales bacterium]